MVLVLHHTQILVIWLVKTCVTSHALFCWVYCCDTNKFNIGVQYGKLLDNSQRRLKKGRSMRQGWCLHWVNYIVSVGWTRFHVYFVFFGVDKFSNDKVLGIYKTNVDCNSLAFWQNVIPLLNLAFSFYSASPRITSYISSYFCVGKHCGSWGQRHLFTVWCLGGARCAK